MNSTDPTPKPSRLKTFLPKAGNYVLGHLVYAGVLAALIFLVFRIHDDVILLTKMLDKTVTEVRSITNLSVLASGLVLFAGVSLGHQRLLDAIKENKMWKALLRSYLFTAAAWAVWLGAYYLAAWVILK